MKAKLSLAAFDIIISADNGVPTAVNIMEAIHGESFPLVIPNIAFLTVWKKEPDDPAQVTATISVKLDEEEIMNAEMTIAFRQRQVARSVARFQGLFVSRPGILTFSSRIGEEIGSCSIDILASQPRMDQMGDVEASQVSQAGD